MGGPPAGRWVREVQAFLGDDADSAGARLRKWCWGEDLGWVLDAPTDRIDMDGDINAFDTTRLLANTRARAPAMLYLFFRIEQRLTGRPLLITVDEGWYVVAEEEVFRPAIERLARTIRSRNGALVFITQSPADVVEAGLAASLVEQFPNQLHFPNPRARREHYVDGLKLRDGEYDALMRLRKGSGGFLLVKGGVSSIQFIPLHGLDDIVAILSTSEANLEAIDAMTDEQRGDPILFQAEFHRRRREIIERARRRRARSVGAMT
jgi:type IV secretion system protein VirB4